MKGKFVILLLANVAVLVVAPITRELTPAPGKGKSREARLRDEFQPKPPSGPPPLVPPSGPDVIYFIKIQ